MIQERGKPRQICQQLAWFRSRERRSDEDPGAGARQRKLMQRLNVSSDLEVSSGGHIVTNTRRADEVGEDGGDQHLDINEGELSKTARLVQLITS